MRKGTIKAAVLLLVFIVATGVFDKVMNHANKDLTMEMQEATLPVITLGDGTREINELRGYVSDMDAAFMRDAITPIGDDRQLPITIRTFQAEVDAISYEIRSLNAERLIANADVKDFERTEGRISAVLPIQNLLEKNEEYLLIIRLLCGERTVCYYTRIMEPSGCHVEECLDFALDFHEKTFHKDQADSLATYMERTTGDNSTLHLVTLNSSLRQISWADFKAERLTMPVPSIKEITDSYTVIVLDYVVVGVGEGGEGEYYNVEEYYRVRYAPERSYLLNFERTMDQIFREEIAGVEDQSIMLGIRDPEVEFRANEEGTSVAFVQEGELWSYSAAENSFAKVFSFRGYEGIDGRENYGEHAIKIAGVDEAGSVDYVVYGYMNRGAHEGEVGMAAYHYDCIANTNEEMVFLPSRRSYEVMRSEVGRLLYVSEAGELFLMLDDAVYGIDLGTRKTREVASGLSEDSFAASASNRAIAWSGEDGSITVKNLSTGKESEISGSPGETLIPLGFMREDFVYGVARDSDVFEDAAGNTTVPMYQVRIEEITDEGRTLLKTYQKDGYFVSGVEFSDYTMYLKRIKYNGSAFVDADQDMIMNREGGGGELVKAEAVNSGQKEALVRLSLGAPVSGRSPRVLTPKEAIIGEGREVALLSEDAPSRYYVYARGEVPCSTESVSEAVIAANEHMGVVLDQEQRYVWKRARSLAKEPLKDIPAAAEGEAQDEGSPIARCLDAMLQREGIHVSAGALIAGGETPREILTDAMHDFLVLDLAGCSVDEVLYYVSCGSPVFAMSGSDKAVLITGYDGSFVYIFDPAAGGATKRIGMADAENLFDGAGRVFFSYLPR